MQTFWLVLVCTFIMGEQMFVGLAMVQLNRTLDSPYGLSTITMSLTAVVWLQLAMLVFGGEDSNTVWGEWL